MAKKLVAADPNKFIYAETKWKKFPDGTDNITLGGFTPENCIAGRNVLFLANFESNDATLTQLYALCALCESFIRTMTILLPFYPTATMERVTEEGSVATANCTAKLLSNLPSHGIPSRVMVYDLHTLQNRFFFGQNAQATLHTAFPLMIQKINENKSINAIVFPDDGAEKRFKYLFEKHLPDMEYVVCGKKRDEHDPGKRKITIKDGNVKGKNVLLVDDLLQTGGTLLECAKAMKKEGAAEVNGFCTHAVLPGNAAERFISGDRAGVFNKIYVTNTFPKTTTKLPDGCVFEVLDITSQILKDL